MGSYHPLKSVQRRFWELVAEGTAPGVAGTVLGVSERCGQEWFYQRGGVNPRLCEPQGQIRPRLTPLERDEITIGAACGESERSMARRLGRAPSTIMREIGNNGGCRGATGRYRARYRFGADRGGRDAKSGYRGSVAQARSEQRATRPRAPSWTAFPSCARWSRICWARSTVPSRSPACCPRCIPIARRCVCRTKPSTSTSTTAFTCRDAASCARVVGLFAHRTGAAQAPKTHQRHRDPRPDRGHDQHRRPPTGGR